MCNINAIAGFLITAQAALVPALVLLSSATHNSSTPSGGSTPLFVLCVALLIVAIVAMTRADRLLAGCSAACPSQTSLLDATLRSLVSILGMQSIAVLTMTVLPPAWFVWAGRVIVSTLFVEAVLLGLASIALMLLSKCASPRGSVAVGLASFLLLVGTMLSLTAALGAIPRG